jgi:group I intron endonuclease
MKKISGIYSIFCVSDQKRYIGFSMNIEERWYFHRRKLNKNIHENKIMQNAWNKYGKDDFEFSIVQDLPRDLKILKLMEVY